MVKISALPPVTPTAADSIPYYDAEGNATGRMTVQNLIDILGSSSGWSSFLQTASVSTGYNKGQKEQDVTFSSSISGILSPGMRFKVDRSTTPPTQCSDLESSSSQYANKTASLGAVSFTDDFTVEAWVKLESYANLTVLSRYNGTSGWSFEIDSTGRIIMLGRNGGAANQRLTQALQSLPLNQWVHIAGSLDMSGFTTATCKIFINGVDIPATLTSGGTNPTALVQAGDLQFGASNTANYFDGKLADVRLWNVVRTATQIRDNMNQQLTGAETGLLAYYKLAGNFNDSTANALNLTGQNSAVATNSDNPMNSTEYGIIVKVSGSTATIFTGADYNIPNMTLSNPYYSALKSPYGFPAQRAKWRASLYQVFSSSTAFGGTNQWTSSSRTLAVPSGDWIVGFNGALHLASSVSGARSGFFLLASTAPTNGDYKNEIQARMYGPTGTDFLTSPQIASNYPINHTAQTTYTFYAAINSSTGSETFLLRGDETPVCLYAECAYV